MTFKCEECRGLGWIVLNPEMFGRSPAKHAVEHARFT